MASTMPSRSSGPWPREPKFGIWGAAFTAVFTEIYAGILLTIITIYYSKFLPEIKNFIKIIIASLIMGITIHLLQPLNIIFSIILGIGISSSLVLIFKIISKETLKEILK